MSLSGGFAVVTGICPCRNQLVDVYDNEGGRTIIVPRHDPRPEQETFDLTCKRDGLVTFTLTALLDAADKARATGKRQTVRGTIHHAT